MTTTIKEFSLTVRQVLFPGAFLVCVLLAPGCATLDKDECLVADWRLIGFQDGAAGKSATAMDDYRKDCARYSVVPDLDSYQAGRSEGLLQYCQPDNGYRLGETGHAYSPVCPPESGAAFRAAYNEGREIYLARSEVNSTHSRIHKKQHALRHLEGHKGEKLGSLVKDGLNSEQRLLLLYEVHEIEQDIDVLTAEISDLQYTLESQQEHLESLRVNSAY